MTIYQQGALGDEVRRLQQELQARGFYRGPLDGHFGGGTAVAVRAFQRQAGLVADGVVGPRTWGALFSGAEPPVPAVLHQPLAHRCLALTGAFETSAPPPECFCGLSGDFDEQGISFGALQWCLGQKSLQPLLEQMDRQHPDVVGEIFDEFSDELRAVLASDFDEQMNWARSIQDQRRRVAEPWRGMLKTLGRRAEFQAIQVAAADDLFQQALGLCRSYGLRSQRAVALLFDIKVQNGGIKQHVEAQIRQDFRALGRRGEADETPRLVIIAERRAAAANPRWVNDVRQRKLAIATGRGLVHGQRYHLEAQYGIGLQAADTLANS
ncbi:MAG: peptidoglycan-binding protein [Pseudomonadota bacterium]|nr:peptidoglycan-binding protein [Pseudomonadota bacterium]